MSNFEQEARRLQLEQANRSISKSFDNLVGKQTRNTIPENLFVNEFLPYFSGQKPIPKDSDVIAIWTTIAGTPFAEVNVITQSGEVAVTVPGLMQTLQNNLNNTKESFKDIITQAEIAGSQISAIGQRYLFNKLDEKQAELINSVMPEAIKPVEEQWQNIFKHYNVATAETTEAKANEKVLDEDVIYE